MDKGSSCCDHSLLWVQARVVQHMRDHPAGASTGCDAMDWLDLLVTHSSSEAFATCTVHPRRHDPFASAIIHAVMFSWLVDHNACPIALSGHIDAMLPLSCSHGHKPASTCGGERAGGFQLTHPRRRAIELATMNSNRRPERSESRNWMVRNRCIESPVGVLIGFTLR